MNIDLAKRAVACEGWRCLRGMRSIHGVVLLEDEGAGRMTWGVMIGGFRSWEVFDFDCSDFLPDLDDPATLGCLEHLVREAWAGHVIDVEQRLVDDFVAWCWRLEQIAFADAPSEFVVAGDPQTFHGNTRAEALVAALENAPKNTETTEESTER